MYSGIAELDAAGAAVIALPDYFVAINAPPYRYLLTPIGAPMPELHVAEEVRDGWRVASRSGQMPDGDEIARRGAPPALRRRAGC